MARSLWPREHGAYVQLAAPLAAALVIAPSLAGTLLAISGCAMFLAHEPLLILLGRRGKRALTEDAERARLRLALCFTIGTAVGLAGLALAPGALRAAAAVGIPAVALIALSWRGQAHTLGGEILAAAALAGVGALVAVAGGAALAAAGTLWIMWALAFTSTVVAVHVVIDCHKRRATARRWLGWIALLAATGLGLGLGALAWPRLAAASPLWLVAVVVVAIRPSARHLRSVGVVLAIAAVATMVWTISV